ncbi:antigen-presenting glycoprotein CD1d-like isoform X2 [Nycticebus coucang]|uniref:antigen-presenting glycoprotein CD1d-like isoform X2 n=1 Tax=Nycticebus coucang TaxID=9470 RepID=UPI00234D6ED4|nr:antigen-presenting glycoprotein CD1d-like isoform X2 [Nycticebus coucang]
MRRLLLLLQVWALLRVLGGPEGPQRSFSFRCLQISSFSSSSRARTDGSAWLGELQTHSWGHSSDAFRFLQPWSRGGFSDQQWGRLQHIFRVYRGSFTREVQKFVKKLQVAYPIQLQLSAGCEVRPGNASTDFFHVAFQGSDFLSFQGTSWEPAAQVSDWVTSVIGELNEDQGTRETVKWLLSVICPQLARSLVEAGASELQKQVKPEAWLSSGPSPGPGRLLLVCHVSGFYPKPVWVMWMRGEQEQPDTQHSDLLPNADWTWYHRATLDVAAGEAAGLSCRVKHSSLEGQDIVLHWGGSRTSTGLVVLAVLACLVSLLVLTVGLRLWLKRCCSYQDVL